MRQFQFSIRTFLVVFVAVAIYFPIRDTYEPWRRQRLTNANYTYLDCEDLCKIREGDSVESVSQRFPTLIAVEPDPTLIGGRGFIRFGPTDKVYRYSYPGGGYNFLHFRDGRLSSHPERAFSDPIAMAVSRGGALPTLFQRATVFPVYLASLILIFAIYFLITKLYPWFRKTLAVSESTAKDNA